MTLSTTQRAAMRVALDALEQLQSGCTDSNDGTVEAITVWCPEVIDALRAALAEPEPEGSVCACCCGMVFVEPVPRDPQLTTQFNAIIDFAIAQGFYAATFLDAWRHGDTSEWLEFDAVLQKVGLK